MDALEAIYTRRSIRSYTDEKVSKEQVDTLLKAAMSAPTAAGQIWRFVVVRDVSALTAVNDFHPHAGMLKTASVGVVVCAETAKEALKGRWPLDCAAAVENMLIAAHSIGLGACWVGIYPVIERMRGLRVLLDIPEDVIPLCVVSLGYPAEEKAPANRFRREFVYAEKWGKEME